MNQDEKFEEARLRFEAWLQRRDRTRVRKAFVALIAVALFGIGLLLGQAVARAHEAPSGWSYPTGCCSNQDCAEVPAKLIREGSDGILVELPIGSHLMVKHWPVRFLVPYQDSRIKESPDGAYHACVSKQNPDQEAELKGGKLICLFVPPKAF